MTSVPALFWLLLLIVFVVTTLIVWLLTRQYAQRQQSHLLQELAVTQRQWQQLQQIHQQATATMAQLQQELHTVETQLTIAETENRQLPALQNALREQQQHNQTLSQQLQDHGQALAVAQQQITHWQQRQQEWQLQDEEQQQLQQELVQTKLDNSRLYTQLKQQQETHTEKLALLTEARETLSQQFKTLANDILEEKSRKFSEQNQHNLNQLLNPLHERLHSFNQLIHNTYEKETKERSVLEVQLERLQQLNHQLHLDAKALTDALTGTQNKRQGNWGEMILEKVLENSGLHKGREYRIQASAIQTDDEGRQRRLQPDVIVDLPDHKHIIIDAKMSLTAYVRYTQADDAETAAQALAAHVHSVRQHIKELSSKDYTQLEGVNTLDFVFMFIPVEPAYLMALQQDNQIFDDCFNQRIMLVGPSTLLATLRTIANIWRNERQNQNAQLIAQEGGKLYDKFIGFVSTMEQLDKSLNQTQEQFQKAMKQLTSGRGNLINRAIKLQQLGIQNSKQLPEHYQQLDNEPITGSDTRANESH
ncbi:DNA recombination protein RmuC [Neisseriaceae bacterium ESL0693]|nr:DNA recombination protein RmuC [Neisseriaceae bacterium ESL0693]